MRNFDLPGQHARPDALQFSPDNRHLAIQTCGRVDVLDTRTGSTRQLCPDSGTEGTAGIGFTADGRGLVYFNAENHSVHAFNLDTRKDRVLRRSKKVPWCSWGDVVISTPSLDGRLVFVAVNPQDGTTEIAALDTSTGKQQFSFARHRDYLRELTVSPDGLWVAGCSARDLRVWFLGGRKLPDRASWHVEDRKQFCFGNLALSRDGAYLAVGGWVGHGPLKVWDLKAGPKPILKGLPERGGGVAFAANRPLLAFTRHEGEDGEVVFWDARARAERKRFNWSLGAVRAVAFSPDGSLCATAGRNRAVIWNVDV